QLRAAGKCKADVDVCAVDSDKRREDRPAAFGSTVKVKLEHVPPAIGFLLRVGGRGNVDAIGESAYACVQVVEDWADEHVWAGDGDVGLCHADGVQRGP